MENVQPETIKWLTLLLAVASLHGLWLAFLLFMKNWREERAVLLGLVFLLVSFYSIEYIWWLTGFFHSFPHWLGVSYPFLFLIGPCYYFFVRFSLDPSYRFKSVLLLHFAPAVLMAWQSVNLYLATTEYKLKSVEWMEQYFDNTTWRILLISNDYIYLLMIYVAVAWWLARKVYIGTTTPENQNAARWIRNFSLAFFLVLLADLALKFGCFAMRVPGFTVEYFMVGLIALSIHVAGYHTLGWLQNFPKIINVRLNGKYKTSPLTPEQMESHQDALLALMESGMPYLDPDLKISSLADQLRIPSHHLSQLLSETMGTNFYDFVNTYRVEAAKQKLNDEKFRHYSILAIGLECGFTSKTTFNRTFKKVTGMTPSSYATLSATKK